MATILLTFNPNSAREWKSIQREILSGCQLLTIPKLATRVRYPVNIYNRRDGRL
jgi:hypothetical protein